MLTLHALAYVVKCDWTDMPISSFATANPNTWESISSKSEWEYNRVTFPFILHFTSVFSIDTTISIWTWKQNN